jgi:hypothetical protein
LRDIVWRDLKWGGGNNGGSRMSGLFSDERLVENKMKVVSKRCVSTRGSYSTLDGWKLFK